MVMACHPYETAERVRPVVKLFYGVAVRPDTIAGQLGAQVRAARMDQHAAPAVQVGGQRAAHLFDAFLDVGGRLPRVDIGRVQPAADLVGGVGVSSALVARDQLQYAVKALSTYDNARVHKALMDSLQSAVNGQATSDAALKKAQADATQILKRLQ